jgi:hypothetical protein
VPASVRILGFGRVFVLGAVGVGLIGLFRLGRQFPAASATPGLLVPFLRPVLVLALEAGAFVALSAAVLGALAPGGATASLSARARHAVLPLVAASVIWVLSAVLPRGTERPGVLANDLIARALAGCEAATTKVPVPLLGLEVRCAEPRRIEGPMPGVGAVRLGMRELSFSDDLRRVRIVGLELIAERALRVKLTAGTAQISGLAPWTRSSQLSPLSRLGLLVGLGAVLSLAACLVWRTVAAPIEPAPSTRGRRWLMDGRRTLLLAAPGVAVAGAVITLDQQRAALPAYGLAALAGVAALLALRLLARFAPKSFSSFGNS